MELQGEDRLGGLEIDVRIKSSANPLENMAEDLQAAFVAGQVRSLLSDQPDSDEELELTTSEEVLMEVEDYISNDTYFEGLSERLKQLSIEELCSLSLSVRTRCAEYPPAPKRVRWGRRDALIEYSRRFPMVRRLKFIEGEVSLLINGINQEDQKDEFRPVDVLNGTRQRLGMSERNPYESGTIQMPQRGKPVMVDEYLMDPRKTLTNIQLTKPSHRLDQQPNVEKEKLVESFVAQSLLLLEHRSIGPFFKLLKDIKELNSRLFLDVLAGLNTQFESSSAPCLLNGEHSETFLTLLNLRFKEAGFQLGEPIELEEGQSEVPILLDGTQIGVYRCVKDKKRGPQKLSARQQHRIPWYARQRSSLPTNRVSKAQKSAIFYSVEPEYESEFQKVWNQTQFMAGLVKDKDYLVLLAQRFAHGKVGDSSSEGAEQLTATVNDRSPGRGKLSKRLISIVKSTPEVVNAICDEQSSIEGHRAIRRYRLAARTRIREAAWREAWKKKVSESKKPVVKTGDMTEKKTKKRRDGSEPADVDNSAYRRAMKSKNQRAKRIKIREEARTKRKRKAKAKARGSLQRPSRGRTHSNKSVRQLDQILL